MAEGAERDHLLPARAEEHNNVREHHPRESKIPGLHFSETELTETWKQRKCATDRCNPDRFLCPSTSARHMEEAVHKVFVTQAKCKVCPDDLEEVASSGKSCYVEGCSKPVQFGCSKHAYYLCKEHKETVKAEDVRGTGISTEDVAELIFRKMSRVATPNFLARIEIDKDGGLDRFDKAIWDPMKYLWAVMALASAVFNVYYLLSTDWSICTGFVTHVVPQLAELRQGSDFNWAAVGDVGSTEEKNSIFKLIENQDVRAAVLTIGTLVAVCEVLGLFIHLVNIFADVQAICCLGGERDYEACTALYDLFRVRLPRLTVYSALKAAVNIHPSLVYTIATEWFAHYGGDLWKNLAVLLLFLLSRLALVTVVVGAFSVKVVAVALQVMHPEFSMTTRILSVVALLNQCIGVILLDGELQDRIFLFVFGGEDAEFQDSERALKAVYLAKLARTVREEYWKKGEYLKAIAILSTLDHYDLQKLLIQRSPEESTTRPVTNSVDNV